MHQAIAAVFGIFGAIGVGSPMVGVLVHWHSTTLTKPIECAHMNRLNSDQLLSPDLILHQPDQFGDAFLGTMREDLSSFRNLADKFGVLQSAGVGLYV